MKAPFVKATVLVLLLAVLCGCAHRTQSRMSVMPISTNLIMTLWSELTTSNRCVLHAAVSNESALELHLPDRQGVYWGSVIVELPHEKFIFVRKEKYRVLWITYLAGPPQILKPGQVAQYDLDLMEAFVSLSSGKPFGEVIPRGTDLEISCEMLVTVRAQNLRLESVHSNSVKLRF